MQRFKGHTGYLGRVDDTGCEKILVSIGTGIVAIVTFAVLDLLNHYCAFFTGIGHDLAEGFFDGAKHDVDTGGLIVIGTLEVFKRLHATDVGHTATGDNAFGDSRTGCRKSIVNAVFLLLHLYFAGSAYMENGNTACELGETFLEFFAVIIACGLLDLGLDLSHTACDSFLVAGTVDNSGVLLC